MFDKYFYYCVIVVEVRSRGGGGGEIVMRGGRHGSLCHTHKHTHASSERRAGVILSNINTTTQEHLQPSCVVILVLCI